MKIKQLAKLLLLPLTAALLINFCSWSASAQHQLSTAVVKAEAVKEDDAAAAVNRWLKKPVLAAVMLDDMEQPARWIFNGGESYKPKNPGSIEYTRERARNGIRSLRLTGKPRGEQVGERDFGSVSVVREFDHADWTSYNRISFWAYPRCSGIETVTLVINLRDEEPAKNSAGARARETTNYVQLKNNSWNQVVWEIPELTRDKVTGIEFLYRMQGQSAPSSKGGGSISFDFDDLELQKVEADYYEGWQVAPGRIAYSQSGYLLNARKTALAAYLHDGRFSLINRKSGKPVLTKAIDQVQTRFGTMAVMDFSEIKLPGEYYIKAGNISTRAFRIAADAWNPSIWKTLNFYRHERCGIAVPGVHAACHFDARSIDGDKSLVINGGWHDAGDTSLGLVKNSESVYSMLMLAESLRQTGGDPKLVAALRREARWGLKWLLKTSFHDGKRAFWTTMARWTDNIIGNTDDVVSKAIDDPFGNFQAAAAEALAARTLKSSGDGIARKSLQMAREDWRFAVAESPAQNNSDDESKASSPLEIASIGVLASLELFKTTGEKNYAAKALELSEIIINSQQREFTAQGIPLAGFFYTNPAKTAIVHYDHLGREQAPIVALAQLCKAFPQSSNWMKWYSAVALYADYQKKIARFNAPYNLLPNGIYSDDEYLQEPERRRESYKSQVAAGIRLNEHFALRTFPVWYDFRGDYGPLLAQAKAVSAAAELRGASDLYELAEQQAEWIVGRNPFGQSTMYGEGADYAPIFSPMSGNLAGGLPGGVMTRGDGDTPYFPNSAMTNYKEIGTHRSARWLWLISDLYSQASAQSESGGLTLRFKAAAAVNADRSLTISVLATGAGKHSFELRGDNLILTPVRQEAVLNKSVPRKLHWQARVENPEAPWFLVIIPDNDLNGRQEIYRSDDRDTH